MAIPRCTVSSATAWAALRESWAVLCQYRCRLLLAEVPKGSNRNAELKHRLQLWEAGDISELVGRVLGATTFRTAKQRTARKKSLRLDGQRIHQQSHERTRGWNSARLGRMSEELDYSLDFAGLGLQSSSRQCGMYRGSACCLERW